MVFINPPCSSPFMQYYHLVQPQSSTGFTESCPVQPVFYLFYWELPSISTVFYWFYWELPSTTAVFYWFHWELPSTTTVFYCFYWELTGRPRIALLPHLQFAQQKCIICIWRRCLFFHYIFVNCIWPLCIIFHFSYTLTVSGVPGPLANCAYMFRNSKTIDVVASLLPKLVLNRQISPRTYCKPDSQI